MNTAENAKQTISEDKQLVRDYIGQISITDLINKKQANWGLSGNDKQLTE